MAIRAERPVHLLLCGPPSSWKSLFMSSLTRLERSYYAVGSSPTKSGIFDYLFEHRPRYFIVDELEKMNKRDQTSLLNLMESGILSELKHKQQRTTQLKTWVFDSCNSTDKLLPPLLTRFRDIHFKPYTEEEFVEIVRLDNCCCNASMGYLPWSRLSIKEKASAWTIVWQCCSPYYSFCSIFYRASSTATHICSYPSWINGIY